MPTARRMESKSSGIDCEKNGTGTCFDAETVWKVCRPRICRDSDVLDSLPEIVENPIGFSAAPLRLRPLPVLLPVPRPVPNASPRSSIRQAGRDDGTRGDWRRDSHGGRRRAIAGRWTEPGRNAIGQLGRYGSSRTMATQQNGQRGGKPHVVTIITGYFFSHCVCAGTETA